MNRTTSDSSNTNSGAHTIGWIATVLVVVGALNWLAVGLFDVNVVASIFGDRTMLTRIVYVLVGVSGLYEIYFAQLLAREANHGISSARPVQ